MITEEALAGTEARYRKVMRAYPVEWRDRNGEALLGALMDRAEAQGRTAPTFREALDLTVRGVGARVSATESVELRRRVASISTGMGVGFTVLYFLLFAAPDSWGNPHPTPQPSVTGVLVVWILLAAVTLLRPRSVWRVLPLLAVAVVPVILLKAPEVPGQGHYSVISAWAGPDNANAAFLFGLALLAAVGPIDRRLMLRSAVIALVAFAVGLLIAAGWKDPYDGTLWASGIQGPVGAPGTLQQLFGSGAHRVPLAQDDGWARFALALQEQARGSVLRLNLLPLGSVAAALIVGVVLIRQQRVMSGRALILTSTPFILALATAATQPANLWLQ